MSGPVCPSFDFDAYDPCAARACLEAAYAYGYRSPRHRAACEGVELAYCCGAPCE